MNVIEGASCDWPGWRAPGGEEGELVVCPEHPCPYLPGREAMMRAFLAGRMEAGAYQRWLDAGFRRSGRVIYQPICRGCRACLPCRVIVGRFEPSKSQRRCRRRNGDLRITIGRPELTVEKYELYQRYQRQWHDGSMAGSMEQCREFLYDSPVPTVEMCYRDGAGRLLAVGICDVGPGFLSSVYFYFQPAEARRGLGTFGALSEIELAQREKLDYYYLGYWVGGCPSMAYKTRFQPCQLLHPEGDWREQAQPEQVPPLRPGQGGNNSIPR